MKESKVTNKDSAENASAMLGAVSKQGDDLGVIQIHESVVASVVRKATCNIDGVSRLAGSSLVDNIAGLVGSKKIHDRAITIKMDGASVEVEVNINAFYGVYIPTVASEVQSAVIDKIEQITGMTVIKVDVIIMELDELDTRGGEVENKEE